MKYIAEAGKDQSNGSRRVVYRCECGATGTTRWSRFSEDKSCQKCTREKARLRTNTFTVADGVAHIDVSTEKFPHAVCLVDAEDINRVIDGKGRWFASDFKSDVVYVVRGSRCEKIHRVIASAPDGLAVDHLNGDGLDNRKKNLELCDQSRNMKNRKLDARNLSGFHGVVPSPTPGRWIAQGMSDGKRTYLGTHRSIDDAAAARAAYEKANGFGPSHGRASSGPRQAAQ